MCCTSSLHGRQPRKENLASKTSGCPMRILQGPHCCTCVCFLLAYPSAPFHSLLIAWCCWTAPLQEPWGTTRLTSIRLRRYTTWSCKTVIYKFLGHCRQTQVGRCLPRLSTRLAFWLFVPVILIVSRCWPLIDWAVQECKNLCTTKMHHG